MQIKCLLTWENYVSILLTALTSRALNSLSTAPYLPFNIIWTLGEAQSSTDLQTGKSVEHEAIGLLFKVSWRSKGETQYTGKEQTRTLTTLADDENNSCRWEAYLLYKALIVIDLYKWFVKQIWAAWDFSKRPQGTQTAPTWAYDELKVKLGVGRR